MQSRSFDPLGEWQDAFDRDSLELSGPLAPGFILARPVVVEIFLENGEYVATVDELNIHAFGASRDEAVRNLRERIVAQRRKLQERGNRLGPAMKQLSDRLTTLVVAEHA